MKKICWTFDGDENKRATIKHLIEILNIPIYGNKEQVLSLKKNQIFCTYEYSGAKLAYSDGGYAGQCENLGFGQFVEGLFEIFTKPKTVEVVLNKEHTAVISKDGIKVGCQTFPMDVIDKLVEGRKEFLKTV